ALRTVLALDGLNRDVQESLSRTDDVARAVVLFDRRTIEGSREERRGDGHHPLVEAQAKRVETLVLQHAVEELRDPRVGAGRDQLSDRVLDCPRDAARTDVEIEDEP